MRIFHVKFKKNVSSSLASAVLKSKDVISLNDVSSSKEITPVL